MEYIFETPFKIKKNKYMNYDVVDHISRLSNRDQITTCWWRLFINHNSWKAGAKKRNAIVADLCDSTQVSWRALLMRHLIDFSIYNSGSHQDNCVRKILTRFGSSALNYSYLSGQLNKEYDLLRNNECFQTQTKAINVT